MVDRPLADHRPIGPFVDLGIERDPERTLGVSGISMPGKSKAPLYAVYVLSGKHRAFLPRDLEVGEPLYNKIKDRLPNSRPKPKQSGSSSAAPFDNQAVIVEIRPEDLPLQDNELHKVADVIDRQYDGTEVSNLLLDTGKGGGIL